MMNRGASRIKKLNVKRPGAIYGGIEMSDGVEEKFGRSGENAAETNARTM